jgi:hypothetical protein
MKKILAAIILLFPAGVLLSCNNNNGMNDRTIKSEPAGSSIEAPPASIITAQQLQAQIDREIRDALRVAADTGVADAAMVVAETHNAIRYLLDSNFEAANRSIENALGKAEVITTANPNLAMVPLEVNVEIFDLVTDMPTLKRIRSDVEDLTDKGYLQAARLLLQDVRSEITVSNSTLPLATYPDALRAAGALVKQRRALEAALVLNAALNTIVVAARAIPLPLVRAEAMLAAADSLINSNAADEQTVNGLLDNADYQIRFAEALGYGKKDKEFGDLYDAIKDLKSEVKKKGSNTKSKSNSLREKLRAFKERISPSSSSKQRRNQ